jgi:hypothetical protein
MSRSLAILAILAAIGAAGATAAKPSARKATNILTMSLDVEIDADVQPQKKLGAIPNLVATFRHFRILSAPTRPANAAPLQGFTLIPPNYAVPSAGPLSGVTIQLARTANISQTLAALGVASQAPGFGGIAGASADKSVWLWASFSGSNTTILSWQSPTLRGFDGSAWYVSQSTPFVCTSNVFPVSTDPLQQVPAPEVVSVTIR